MATIAECKRDLIDNLKCGTATMVFGPPGIGKSDMFAQAGLELGLPVITFSALLHETVDLRGNGVADLATGTTRWMRPHHLPLIGNDHMPDECIVFFDEINAGAPSMMAALMQCILAKKAGEHTFKPGVLFGAAGNEPKHKAIANKMPTALLDRMVVLYAEPDCEALIAWMTAEQIDPMMIAFVRSFPKHVHAELDPNFVYGKEHSFVTPRGLAIVAKMMRAGFADKESRFRRISGKVGAAVATDLCAFIDMHQGLPKLADIVSDPDNTAIPEKDQPGQRYAVAGMLSRRATASNFAPILQYAGRFPREFEIVIAVDAVKRDASLKQTPAFVSWALRNQDVIV